MEKRKSGERTCGGVEERIELSKVHWSTLNEADVMEGDEEVIVSNVKEFLALQRDPNWGSFFQTFGYDLGDLYPSQGKLVLGKKFAEGGQAELYDCKLKVWNSTDNDTFSKLGKQHVLKVFKEGTCLKDIKFQLPQGLLHFHAKAQDNRKSVTPNKIPRLVCKVHFGTLLKDGRFAFLMEKEHFDLRHLIIEKMKLSRHKDCGPFSKEEVELILYDVALGVDWLHRRDIVHRDLKASNVLVSELLNDWRKYQCFVADYECSKGVQGTGFFRAPEILQALKEQKLKERPEVFSKAADIYAYGMIGYEILTGKLPFEDHLNDHDHVLNGHRPLVPEHAEDWIHKLLDRCWHLDPTARPSIEDILSVILTHSEHAGRREKDIRKSYGQNYKEGYCGSESR